RPITMAWRTAAKWMAHIGRERGRLRELVARSQLAHTCTPFTPSQCTIILAALRDVELVLANVLRSKVVISLLPMQLVSFLELGIDTLAPQTFGGLQDAAQKEADRLSKADISAASRAWAPWARGAFARGASVAHKASKVPVPDEILPWIRLRDGMQPYALINNDLREWAEIWDRLWAMMCRIPKPDSGHRLIAVLDSFLRILGRCTSSDGAFENNLQAETGVLKGFFVASALLDLTKAYDMARPSQLFKEGPFWGYPPRMMWMLIQQYCMPRRLKGHGSISEQAPVPLQPRMLVDDVSIQYVGPGKAGIARLAKAVELFQQDSRDLSSRFNFKKSGLVLTTRASRAEAVRLRGRIPVRSWMRNLGHETMGVRPSRQQERMRANQMLKRKRRLLMFKGVAGRTSSILWRSGAQPSVGHGAGVAGVSGEVLKQMRSVAALVA
ncbi:unnamed protein product, partial [Prorocentrum cordatum]